MFEMQDRLRDKTLQIAQLQQRIETLEAQLQGTHRRSAQLNEQLLLLEKTLVSKDNEINGLRTELSCTKDALESVGKEIRGMRAKQSEHLVRTKPDAIETEFRNQLENTESIIETKKEAIRVLSEAATSVLCGSPGGVEHLQEAVMEFGDLKYKALNIVLARRTIRIDELASILFIEIPEAHEILDELQSAGEIEIRGEVNVLPGGKYREITIPVDDWRDADPSFIFNSLEKVIGKMDENEVISKALGNAVDIIEQKLARGGALVFQMRKAADFWSKKNGNKEELLYSIREWKERAASLR